MDRIPFHFEASYLHFRQVLDLGCECLDHYLLELALGRLRLLERPRSVRLLLVDYLLALCLRLLFRVALYRLGLGLVLRAVIYERKHWKMAVSTTMRRGSDNRLAHGWTNIYLMSSTGVSAGMNLTLDSDLVVTTVNALPNNGWRCQITGGGNPLPRNNGKLRIKDGKTVTG